MMATRAVVVGAGLMGRWHAAALRHCGGDVVTVIDPDRRRAEPILRRFPSARYSSDVSDLGMREGDVAHICTPLQTHRSLAMTALEHGLHVIVEKPLVPSGEETRHLLEAAAGAERTITPVHQFVFQRGFRRFLSERPQIGRVRHIEYVAATAGADSTEISPDDLAADILPHPLSVLQRLIDRPLPQLQWRAERPSEGEVRVTTRFGETSVAILISTHIRPPRNELRIFAENGTAHVNFFHGYAIVETPQVSRTRKILQPFTFSLRTLGRASENLVARAGRREPAYPGLRELIARAYHSFQGRERPPFTPEEILDNAIARDRVLDAAEATPSPGTGS